MAACEAQQQKSYNIPAAAHCLTMFLLIAILLPYVYRFRRTPAWHENQTKETQKSMSELCSTSQVNPKQLQDESQITAIY